MRCMQFFPKIGCSLLVMSFFAVTSYALNPYHVQSIVAGGVLECFTEGEQIWNNNT